MSIEYPCVYWNDGMCKKFSDDKATSWCVEGPCGDQIPSNADRIRSMSDEELAKFIRNLEISGLHEKYCLALDDDECILCADCVVKWLHQPPKEVDT